MERVRLRTARVSDAAALLAIYAPYVRETAITFEYDVPDEREFAARIRHVLEKFPYLVAEADGEIVGYAYAGAFHPRAAYQWCAEMSVYVKRDARRMGIGKTLYAAMEEILRMQRITNAEACIAMPNEPDEHLTLDSVKFHTKMGYRMVGRFTACGYKYEQWYDMVWMEKLIGEHLPVQRPVRPIGEVRAIVAEKYETDNFIWKG